jgi:hypothetical protein
MPRKKLPGKRKFKRTKFGARALKGARAGTGGIKNPSGTRSSVRTATIDIPGKKGRTDVAVIPTIRKDPSTGQLKRLAPKQAARVALQMGDFVRVKAKKKETVEQTRARGDKRSRKFSTKLGKISAKRSKRTARKKARTGKR